MISLNRSLLLVGLLVAGCNAVEVPQGDFCKWMNAAMEGKLQFSDATIDQMSEVNQQDIATIKVKWSQCPGMENKDVDEAFSRLKERLENQQ